MRIYLLGQFNISFAAALSHFQREGQHMASSLMLLFYGIGSVVWSLVFQLLHANLPICFLMLAIGTACVGFICIICLSSYVKPPESQLLMSGDIQDNKPSPWHIVRDLCLNPSFWATMWIFFIGCGGTVNFISNVQAVDDAIGSAHPASATKALYEFGISQTIGRMVVIVWTGWKRNGKSLSPMPLVVVQMGIQMMVFLLAALLIYHTTTAFFWALGLSYGMCWTLFYSIVNYLFADECSQVLTFVLKKNSCRQN